MSDHFKEKTILNSLRKQGFNIEGLIIQRLSDHKSSEYFIKFIFDNYFLYTNTRSFDDSLFLISKLKFHVEATINKFNNAKKFSGDYNQFIEGQILYKIFYERKKRIYLESQIFSKFVNTSAKKYFNVEDFMEALENIDFTPLYPLSELEKAK